ncbi:hypothetical protein BC332_28050 [Capsicum chinense]|nr:hypothetical protein BC332_28050 [Capsicum chinense]
MQSFFVDVSSTARGEGGGWADVEASSRDLPITLTCNIGLELSESMQSMCNFMCLSFLMNVGWIFPLSFIKSALPPLWPTFLYGFFLLGLLGFLMQVLGLLGLQYSSPLLSTTIMQLSPGFTFILIVILRMEKFENKSLSTVAKTIGTLVLIIGALVATLYKGPQIFGIGPLNSILTTHSDWVIGGLLTMICSLIASVFIISQAFVLKKYPTELILMLFYSCCIAILCAISSLVTERDRNSWSLSPRSRLMALIYSGLFGNVFQLCIGSWCIKKKGPFFVIVFQPLGTVIALGASMFMGEIIYVGSLVGSIIIVVGFFLVIWGKAKEWNKEEKGLESNNKMPLLHDKVNDDRKNSKNNSCSLAITPQSGKSTIDPPMHVFDEVRDDVVDIDNALEDEFEKLVTSGESSQKLTSVNKRV